MVLLFHRGSRTSSRNVFLTLCDCSIIVLAQLLAVFFRLGVADGLNYLQEHGFSMVCASVIFMLVFYAGGMYELPMRRRRLDFDFLPLVVTSIAAALTGLLLYTRPQMTLGRGIWMISSLLILGAVYISRRVFLHLLSRGYFRKRAILVCDTPERITELLNLVQSNSFSPYSMEGVVGCGETELPEIPLTDGSTLPVLGRPDQLAARIEELEISTILLGVSAMRSRELLPQLRPLRYAGVEIMDYVSLSEELAREIPLSQINDEWLMTAALNSSVLQIRKMKRFMDVTVSIVGLIPGIPLMMLCGILIKLTSPGPVFYCQRRVGLGGEPYLLYKLRTMRTDAEANGAVWAKGKDTRVTRVGYFLRKWRLDEIPQLFNIIKGEMSLVGPRPERPEFTEKLSVFIPFYDERTLVQPGLTGWAQVRFPYAASFEAAARKLQFDLYYIKNMSVLFDVSILLRTFKTILVGLRHEDESLKQTDDKLEALVMHGFATPPAADAAAPAAPAKLEPPAPPQT